MGWIGRHRPVVRPGDLEAIRQPLDLLGVNYYNAETISFDVDGLLLKARAQPLSDPGWGRTTMGWGIAPSGLTAVLIELHDRYPGLPMMITENGCAFDEQSDAAGVCDDRERIDYLRAHIQALGTAMDRGVDVRGCLLWPLLDNFEWAFGYSRKLDLVAVEPGTLCRIPKASAAWYSSVARSNGLPSG